MKRWTNGLPGATKRLGAMMAQRGLSASQPRMRADTHDGPEQMLHVRGLIHCCSSHVRRSWSFCLATHGPGHTSWHNSIARFSINCQPGRVCDGDKGPFSGDKNRAHIRVLRTTESYGLRMTILMAVSILSR